MATLSSSVIFFGQLANFDLLIKMLLDTFDDEERVGIPCVGLLLVGSLKFPHKRRKGWPDTTGGVSGLADSCSAWDLVQRAESGLLASRKSASLFACLAVSAVIIG